MNKIFTSGAHLYEIFSDNESRLKREGQFLIDLLRRAPGLSVVDMACGTGLHAEFFAQNQARVDAFDLSSAMIDYARNNRSHPSITYATGDMRELSGGPWDLAVCLGNSLSLLTDENDVHRTFRAVFSSLSLRGLFVAQILNYQAAIAQKPRNRIEQKTVGNTEVIGVKNLVPHDGRTFLSLAFYAVSGKEFESVSESAVLRNWSVEDIVSAAEGAGFTVEAVYGGYDKSEYNPEESTDVLVVLQKSIISV